MRVFVVGASGAIGTRLVPQLIERGHKVIGTSRSPGNAEGVRALGAEAVTLDLLDARAVRDTVLDIGPDAIVHQATALGDVKFTRKFDQAFAQTNRLRTEGTDALLAAAREAGVPRFVAQSFASARHERRGGWVKTENDPLDPDPLPSTRESQAAMRYLDEAVTDAGGIILRYGGFYGASNDGLVEPVRKRQFPIVGDGDGVSRSSTSTTPPPPRCSPSIQRFRHLQHRRRRTRASCAMAPRARRRTRRQAAAPCSSLAGTSAGRRRGGDDRDRIPRRLQCQGQARAGVVIALPELA